MTQAQNFMECRWLGSRGSEGCGSTRFGARTGRIILVEGSVCRFRAARDLDSPVNVLQAKPDITAICISTQLMCPGAETQKQCLLSVKAFPTMDLTYFEHVPPDNKSRELFCLLHASSVLRRADRGNKIP